MKNTLNFLNTMAQVHAANKNKKRGVWICNSCGKMFHDLVERPRYCSNCGKEYTLELFPRDKNLAKLVSVIIRKGYSVYGANVSADGYTVDISLHTYLPDALIYWKRRSDFDLKVDVLFEEGNHTTLRFPLNKNILTYFEGWLPLSKDLWLWKMDSPELMENSPFKDIMMKWRY